MPAAAAGSVSVSRSRALDGGADDYVSMPFWAAELLARIRVALRHGMAGATPDGTCTVSS
jgi:DNA-binding response OmpR family regulator